MNIAIVDYGMGNLASVNRALSEVGASSFIAERPGQLKNAKGIILPGVGSFADGMAHLAKNNWIEAIRREVLEGKPILGICLGMQLLATKGTEGGLCEGLNLISGEVKRLDALGCEERIPHVGWNNTHIVNQTTKLLAGIPNNTDFYFVHSFAFQPTDPSTILADIQYGIRFPAVIGHQHVFGAQFHPEKSSRLGLRLLRNFTQVDEC
jgi:imidazole glycerol-phosphate synthase subunit HisH